MNEDEKNFAEKKERIIRLHEETMERNNLMQLILKCHDVGDYLNAMYYLSEIKKYSGSKIWEIYYPKTLEALIANNVNPDLYCEYLIMPAIEP